MVEIPNLADPTLAAMDAALVAGQGQEPRRLYLGMSAVGNACSRKLWYDLHCTERETFDAATLKRFADGHAGEALMAKRLRDVPGLELATHKTDGEQFGFEDHEGRFRGHMDGAIHGLLQAPDTWHVWEHKVCNEKKHAELTKAKHVHGEKDALSVWDVVYYAQAVLYMDYSGMQRHYLTCSTPGERATVSVRTEANPAMAAVLKDKAKRIINARAPLARLSNDPNWFVCKWCFHRQVCHGVSG